jgi:tellurite methyltransferase
MDTARIERFFDAAYSNTERYWWKHPNAYSVSPEDHAGSLMAQQVLRYALARSPGCAIDLGSGEGTDAIRLALLGWEVHALELTKAGVEKTKRRAAQVGVRIYVLQGDLQHFVARMRFDLVVCNGVLHYVENKREICEKIQALTVPGGVNAISLWSDYTPVPECHRVIPTFPDKECGDVVAAYADWGKSLLYFERCRAEIGHDDMPEHVHSFIKMIAHKPHETQL